MVARGAKRPRSELRGVLQAFQPLSVSWAGAGELKTLHARRMARRPAAGHRLGAPVRLLSERAAAQDAAARGSASAALFVDYRRHAGEARRQCGAGAGAAPVRSAAAGRARLCAAADARSRHGTADRSAGTVLLRLRPRAAHHGVGAGTALSAGARRDAARARGAGLQRPGGGARGQAADARGARPLSRAARDIQPPRRARPAGARRHTKTQDQ